MLTEVKNARQIPGEGHRRWFRDGYFDLIVWYRDDKIEGFQLCYDTRDKPRAITWRASSGYSHDGIDDGERSFAMKMTPILVPDGTFEKDVIAERFKEASGTIDKEISSLVHRVLKDYPD